MITGHLTASYTLSQVPALWGHPLPAADQWLIILSGNILDLDLLFSHHLGENHRDHHLLPTHTPFFALILFLLVCLLFGRMFTPLGSGLSLAALLLHLLLDDISHWFYRFGWQKISSTPEILWLWPFKNYFLHKKTYRQKYISENTLLRDYFSQAKINIFLEILFALIAIIIFYISKNYSR